MVGEEQVGSVSILIAGLSGASGLCSVKEACLQGLLRASDQNKRAHVSCT